MARIAMVRDILERVWPRITEGDEESIIVRGVWRAAWETLQEHGILAARLIGTRCRRCKGTGRVLPEDALDDGSPIDETMECPVCHGQLAVSLVDSAAWEAAVCRSEGLPLKFNTKAEAMAHYVDVTPRRERDFERWWSGLETRLMPIARALLSGSAPEADAAWFDRRGEGDRPGGGER